MDRSLGQGRSLPAGARALQEAPAAAGSKGWGLRTAAHASSLPGPSGWEAAEQKRETLRKSSLMTVPSLSTGQRSKNVVSHQANPPKTRCGRPQNCNSRSSYLRSLPNYSSGCKLVQNSQECANLKRSSQRSVRRRHRPINQSQRNQANIEQKAGGGGGGENIVDLLSY